MTQLKHSRRRQLIVNKPLQSRIIFRMCWPALVGLIVCATLLGILCTRLADEALVAKVELPSMVPVLITISTFLILAAYFVFASALQFSNKIAGPIYRMNKTLQAFRAGDTGARAVLRDGDTLIEVADGINEFLEWLEQHPPAGEGWAEVAAAEETEESALAGAARDS